MEILYNNQLYSSKNFDSSITTRKHTQDTRTQTQRSNKSYRAYKQSTSSTLLRLADIAFFVLNTAHILYVGLYVVDT